MGLVPVMSASALEAEERAAAQRQQQSPLVLGLAAHVDKRWQANLEAKRGTHERLLRCLRQRNGEYDPDKLRKIREFGGSEIFVMLSSAKARGAAAWLRDALLGTGTDKPWQLDHTPIPDLPPDVVAPLQQQLTELIFNYVQTAGSLPPQDQVRKIAEEMRDSVRRKLDDEAKKRVDRMELKMEDQLAEGGFRDALSAFLDDIVTFPAACIKGPVLRKRKILQWANGGLVPVEVTRPEWERVSPFNIYPAPWATSPNEGPFIEHMPNVTREMLQDMRGLDGFSEVAVQEALRTFGQGTALNLSTKTEEIQATNKDATGTQENQSDIGDILILWDDIPGKVLQEWGLEGLEDLERSYPAEVWKIGPHVIRAVLNHDPLGRRNYYMASYERVPGAIWGNGVLDLIADAQEMCNASARALSNNMGMASGPMVGVDMSRLPAGTSVNEMHPWKVWQFEANDFASSAAPISFFQPNSNAQELMAVFEKWMDIADSISGIPRYLMGEHQPGVGRTSSGLSMLIGNASKGIKSVIGTIDTHVFQPALERLYQHNLRFSDDPDLIGDVSIVAKGAMSLIAKEAAAVRRSEFLQLVLNSPVAQQIVGLPGTAELLREGARLLDLNPDRVVPTREQVEQQIAQQQAQQQAMMQAAMSPDYEDVEFRRDDTGAVTGARKVKPKTLLPDGSVAGGRDSNVNRNRVTGANT